MLPFTMQKVFLMKKDSMKLLSEMRNDPTVRREIREFVRFSKTVYKL